MLTSVKVLCSNGSIREGTLDTESHMLYTQGGGCCVLGAKRGSVKVHKDNTEFQTTTGLTVHIFLN